MSKEDIYNLELDNLLVYNWLKLYQYHKEISYTEALEGMVVSLVEENNHLKSELIKLHFENGSKIYKEFLKE